MAAGGLPALAFPRAGLWWLAQLGLVPLVLLVRAAPSGREAAVRGWLGAAGFLAATHYWLAPYAGPFLLVIALLAGVLWLGWGVLAWRLLGGRSSAVGVAVAAVLLAAWWVGTEVVRSWEHLGGPFGLLGSSQWATPWTLAPAAAGGVWAVSFLAVAVNVGVAAALAPGAAARARVTGVVVAVAVAAVGPAASLAQPEAPTGAAAQVRVGVVQIARSGTAEARFAAHERATRALAGQGVDMVVWGESSVGADLHLRRDLTARLQALAREVGADVLVNTDAVRAGGAGIYKSTVQVTAAGIAGRYDKMRLVPFGEHVPLRTVFGWVARVTEAAEENRRRGTAPVLLDVGGVQVGPLVSFETSFPDMSRQVVRRGADLVVMQSSTASFQRSWAPAQLASLAGVRAVETGRPVVHVALTGVTAAFDARGQRLAWHDTGQQGAWVISVPLNTPRAQPGNRPQPGTLYVRWGQWVPAASVALLLTAGAVALARTWSRRGSRRQTAPGSASRG